jgi:hypothetical protein
MKARFVACSSLAFSLLTACPSSQRVPNATQSSQTQSSQSSVEPTASEALEQPFLFSATFTDGFCSPIPLCGGELNFTAANSGGDTFLALFNPAIGVPGAPTPFGSAGVLSAKSRAYLHSLLDSLSSGSLETQYPGCGAACDGWSVLLQYVSPGRPTIRTHYTRDGLGETPQVIQALDVLIESLVQDLSTCQATERVTPVPDCTALS